MSNLTGLDRVRVCRKPGLTGCLLLVVLWSGPLSGQGATGSVLGAVTDETGQLLAGARVNAVSENTGAERHED